MSCLLSLDLFVMAGVREGSVKFNIPLLVEASMLHWN